MQTLLESRIRVLYTAVRIEPFVNNDMTQIEELPYDARYLIFQALSHPFRVRMLTLIEQNELTFASLKRELGTESSGQLQHHLEKLSGLITFKQNGSYGLTDEGKRALDIYRESEKSGSPLEDLCCIPTATEMAHDKQISGSGTILRLSIGSILLALTAAIIASYLFWHQAGLNFLLGGYNISFFGIEGAIIFGFFGASFLISGVTGYPGCEITAIPNLFLRRKRYCSCLITPFNLPNGRLLQKERLQ